MKFLKIFLVVSFGFLFLAKAEEKLRPIVVVRPPKVPIVIGTKPQLPSKGSSDGITNVNNGGGLAEMRLIYLHQNLDRFLQICLTEANVCQLSEPTRTEWQRLVLNQNRDSGAYVISFLPKIENEKGYNLAGHQIIISSQMLYVDLETPKQFGSILAFLIAVRQDLAGSKISFADNLKIATNIFTTLNVEESLYRATGVPALLRLAQLKVYDGIQFHFLFSIEDTDKTIDLTKMLADALPCGKLSDWSFSQWNSAVSSTGYFYGYANGICNGQTIQKRIVIQVELSSKYIIDASKLTTTFFAI